MDLQLVSLAVFSILSLSLLPLPASLSTILALLIVISIKRVVNRHLSAKPDVLRRLRQRMYICMSVGVLLEFIFYFFSLMIILVSTMVYALCRTTPDGSNMSHSNMSHSNMSELQKFEPFGRELHANDTAEKWRRGAFLLGVLSLPRFLTALITPWILTLDYSQVTLIHSRVEDLTSEILVKDIVAFSAAGAIGMRTSYILLRWLVELFTFIIKAHNQRRPIASTLGNTALNVMLALRTSVVIAVCQMAYCIAAAERDVLGRKKRFWIAFGYCATISFPLYFEAVVFVVAPVVNRIPELLWIFFWTGLSFGFLEHLRRRYCYLLSTARQLDAEQVMLPTPFSPKAA